MKALITPIQALHLERLPKTHKGDLRAWDAADELILQHIMETDSIETQSPSPILIINDAFGALSLALHRHNTHNWSDSYLSHLALNENAKRNAVSENTQIIPASKDLTTHYQIVLIKIPKTLSLLEDQLCRLKPHLSDTSIIIGGGMSKHIHKTTLSLFEKIIGPTTTSRARKKARLIFADNKPAQRHDCSPPKTITDDALSLHLLNHANVFSQHHLDIGTRFMLEHLSLCPSANRVIDLGCGNGALGIVIKRHQPNAKLSFLDESYMAIRSAKQNWLTTYGDHTDAQFYVSNCLDQYQDEQPQLILCNPPFHQAHSIGDQIAWKMFKDSYKELAADGELWVIGNRHLAYHSKLKRVFGHCQTVASNKKFVLLKSKKISTRKNHNL